MNVIDQPTFNFFDLVWLRTDEDGEAPGVGQVIGVLYKPNSTILYQVQWGIDRINFHYAEELKRENPNAFKTS